LTAGSYTIKLIITTDKGCIDSVTHDVVINELFPDPEPQVALPQGEYIELYNKTNYAITLKNWMLTVGTNDILIPDAVILPDSFLVLIDNTSLNSFINEGYGNIPLLVLDAMSSTELNVSDEDVILKDQNGNLIDSQLYNMIAGTCNTYEIFY
jgi:hypothetical protein